MSDVSGKTTPSTLPSAPLLNDCMYASCYCEENIYKLIGTLVQSGAAKLNDLTAVVISNTSKQMPLWCQKSSFEEDGLVVWDYHVILAQRGQPPPHASSAAKEEEHGGSWVWDLDTSLPWPCPAPLYAARALHWGHMHHLSQRYQRRYRAIPAATYLDHFSSDRSHMRRHGHTTPPSPSHGAPNTAPPPPPPTQGTAQEGAGQHGACEGGENGEGGGWLKPPPPWPCIVSVGGVTHALPVLWNMSKQGAQADRAKYGVVMEEGEFVREVLGVKDIPP